jgi:hypothetical protein
MRSSAYGTRKLPGSLRRALTGRLPWRPVGAAVDQGREEWARQHFLQRHINGAHICTGVARANRGGGKCGGAFRLHLKTGSWRLGAGVGGVFLGSKRLRREAVGSSVQGSSHRRLDGSGTTGLFLFPRPPITTRTLGFTGSSEGRRSGREVSGETVLWDNARTAKGQTTCY